MRVSNEKVNRRLLNEDLKQLKEDKDALRLLLKLLTLAPEKRKLLLDLTGSYIQVAKDPQSVNVLEAILDLSEYQESLEVHYKDVRMLEEVHSTAGLNPRDLALLECRHILGRQAFSELSKSAALGWLNSLSLSALHEDEDVERPKRGGAPLSPSTVSAYIKLCCLTPTQRIISDEIEDILKQHKSRYESQRYAKRAYQKAARRLERLLKKIGFSSRAEFDKNRSLLALLMRLGMTAGSKPDHKLGLAGSHSLSKNRNLR